MFSTMAETSALTAIAAVAFMPILAGFGWALGPPKEPKKKAQQQKQGEGPATGGPSGKGGVGNAPGAPEMTEEEEYATLRNLPPEQKEQFKSVYNQVIQQARALLSQGKIEEAKDTIERIRKFSEHVFGKDSKEYSSATFLLGSIHESMGDNDEARLNYIESFNSFKTAKDFETAGAVANAIVRMTQLIAAGNGIITKNDKPEIIKYYTEVARWSEITMDMIKQAKDIDEAVKAEKIWNTAASFTNRGFFKRAEQLFVEALQLLKPSDSASVFWDVVNMYSSCLLQQQKYTQAMTVISQARTTLEQLLTSSNALVSKSSTDSTASSPLSYLGSETQTTIVNIVLRLAEIAFLEEKFQDSEGWLQEAVALSIKYGVQLAPKVVNDLACVALELGDEKGAREFLREVKSMPPSHELSSPIKSRSRYLSTISTAVDNDYNEQIAKFFIGVFLTDFCLANGVRFYISLTVCQIQANRIEGDPLIQRPRKLPENFFIEAKFENTISDQPPLIVPQEVLRPEFTVESPVMESAKKKYYVVQIDIFKDNTKSQKLGSHIQLIYVSPTLALRKQRMQKQKLIEEEKKEKELEKEKEKEKAKEEEKKKVVEESKKKQNGVKKNIKPANPGSQKPKPQAPKKTTPAAPEVDDDID